MVVYCDSLIMQDLYEVAYAFNTNCNMVAYCVYVMIPRQFVPCTGTFVRDLKIGQSPVLVVEEGGDVLPFLAMNGNEPNEVYSMIVALSKHILL